MILSFEEDWYIYLDNLDIIICPLLQILFIEIPYFPNYLRSSCSLKPISIGLQIHFLTLAPIYFDPSISNWIFIMDIEIMWHKHKNFACAITLIWTSLSGMLQISHLGMFQTSELEMIPNILVWKISNIQLGIFQTKHIRVDYYLWYYFLV